MDFMITMLTICTLGQQNTGHGRTPVLDRKAKASYLAHYCEFIIRIRASNVGDGANDLAMLKLLAWGRLCWQTNIARYNSHSINHTDLRGLLCLRKYRNTFILNR